KQMIGEEIVVVSPKNSGVQRARSLSEYLGATLASVDQVTAADGQRSGYVIGDVSGKTCILVDDILNTGATLVNAAEILQDSGAKAIYACASHGLLSDEAKATLEKSPIKEMTITDSIDTPVEKHPENLS
ncbi:phosphoribosyltransferase family protein, partial [Enterococcus faecalis]